MKKILVVHAPDYTTIELMFNSFNSTAYRLATHLRNQGNDVEVCDLRPEIHQYYNKDVRFRDGEFYFKDVRIHEKVRHQPCGNWDKEHLSKPIHRVGLPISELITALVSRQVDEVYISAMFTYLWEGVSEVIQTIKMFSPESKIILGGIYPSLCPDHARHLGADEIMPGRTHEIDALKKVDLTLWKDPPIAVDVMTGLGCYNACGYCAVHILEGRQHITRDPIEVCNEIEGYLKAGVKYIRFLDSNILWNFENHFEIIVDELLRRNLKAEYCTYGGMDTSLLSPDKLAKFIELGFIDIEIPIETSSAKLQKRWNRNLSAKTWSSRVKALLGLGVPLRTFVLSGCPGQTIEDIMDTVHFVEDNGVKPFTLFFTPIPGTVEWLNCQKEIAGRSLEELNPLLFPMANDQMTARDLQGLVSKYMNYTMSFISEHPKTCNKESLRRTI